MSVDFEVNDERVKRAIDRRILETTNLEDIIIELRRRGMQIMEGRGFNMRCRVVLLPASIEPEAVKRERPEVTRGTEEKSGAAPSDLGVQTERQDIVPDGEGTHVPESVGSSSDREEETTPDRVQGDEGGQDSIPGSEQPSDTSTDGLRATVSEEA